MKTNLYFDEISSGGGGPSFEIKSYVSDNEINGQLQSGYRKNMFWSQIWR